MRRLALLGLAFWWFVAIGSINGGPGGYTAVTTIGPFASRADCDAIRLRVATHVSVSEWCWWDGRS